MNRNVPSHTRTYSKLKSIIHLHKNTRTFRYNTYTHTHTLSTQTLLSMWVKWISNVRLGPPPHVQVIYVCVCVCFPAFIDIEIRWGQMEGGVNGAGSPFVCMHQCALAELFEFMYKCNRSWCAVYPSVYVHIFADTENPPAHTDTHTHTTLF